MASLIMEFLAVTAAVFPTGAKHMQPGMTMPMGW